MRAEALLLLLALFSVTMSNQAEEPEQDSEQSDLPDLDLLEFLGEFASDNEQLDGQWIDPLELIEEDTSVSTEARQP